RAGHHPPEHGLGRDANLTIPAPHERPPNPQSRHAMNRKSARVTGSPRSHGANTTANSGLVAWRKTVLAAVVSLFANTNRRPGAAYPTPTSPTRQPQP